MPAAPSEIDEAPSAESARKSVKLPLIDLIAGSPRAISFPPRARCEMPAPDLSMCNDVIDGFAGQMACLSLKFSLPRAQMHLHKPNRQRYCCTSASHPLTTDRILLPSPEDLVIERHRQCRAPAWHGMAVRAFEGSVEGSKAASVKRKLSRVIWQSAAALLTLLNYASTADYLLADSMHDFFHGLVLRAFEVLWPQCRTAIRSKRHFHAITQKSRTRLA